ncbi:MAG: MFS transporter [Bacillaceae bacterium]
MGKNKFLILVASVGISGLSQGMLLPVLAIILENSGASAAQNGLHATGIALGTLLVSPFLERPMRKYGFKPIILLGGVLVIGSLIAFPLWKSLTFWFILRMIVGVGDYMLHLSSQTWLTSTLPPHELGKKISIYGLSFGIGFMIGPLMTSLLSINEAIPFIISAILSLCTWLLMFLLPNEFPKELPTEEKDSSIQRYKKVIITGWAILLAPLAYGIIEASLNSNFPVYALRINYSVEQISILLPLFALGGIITQIPLGMLSDKLGGKIVVPSVLGIGGFLFIITSFVEQHYYALFALIFCLGMVIGSTFSLGLKYMSEIIPIHLLPTSNMLFGVAFSLGSILGPTVGGMVIDKINGISLFVLFGMVFLLFFLLNLLFMKQKKGIGQKIS